MDVERPCTNSRGREGLPPRLARVLFGVPNPAHHVAQLAPDMLNGVLASLLAELVEHWATNLIFQQPLPCEGTGLNFTQNSLHLCLGLLGDDARPAGVIAILGRVRDGMAHPPHATLVD